MEIIQQVNSVFSSNTWILRQDNSAYLIDCGDVNVIIEDIVFKDIQIKGVFLTHSHFDHIYGLNRLVAKFPECVIYTSLHGKEGLFSDKLNFSRYHSNPLVFQGGNIQILEEGDEVQLFPNVFLKAMSTPGHDWSCISYYTDEVLFTGDSYIPNIKVVTSFPKSNKVEAQISLDKILNLAKTRHVYPGHGEVVKNNYK